eukprot:Platyproteum_vivax@DN17115_c0_g1_i1.p1
MEADLICSISEINMSTELYSEMVAVILKQYCESTTNKAKLLAFLTIFKVRSEITLEELQNGVMLFEKRLGENSTGDKNSDLDLASFGTEWCSLRRKIIDMNLLGG